MNIRTNNGTWVVEAFFLGATRVVFRSKDVFACLEFERRHA